MVGLVAYRRPKPQTDANASCGWGRLARIPVDVFSHVFGRSRRR
ncbi:hypothetical protein [Microtetraspora malaysiensis]|uniref:Uncharacterized protein n=1 Tax=Microtetraspora malaysiensis TaxID=161358 RepID=A0ABW6T262_9ACTN